MALGSGGHITEMLGFQQETFGHLPPHRLYHFNTVSWASWVWPVVPSQADVALSEVTSVHPREAAHCHSHTGAPAWDQCVPLSPLSLRLHAVAAVLSTLLLCRGVFLSLIQKHFPSTRRRRDRGGGKRKSKNPRGSSSWLCVLCSPPLEDCPQLGVCSWSPKAMQGCRQDWSCPCVALREAKFWDKTPVGSNLRPPSSSPTRWQMGQPLHAAQPCFLAVSMLIVGAGLCPESTGQSTRPPTFQFTDPQSQAQRSQVIHLQTHSLA